MYEKPFALQIVAPDRVVFNGEVTSVSTPGVEGGFQVLVDHAPLLSSLGVGEIKLRSISGEETRYATWGGFVEVRGNTVVILVEAAERAGDINVQRAQASRERAEERLHSKAKDIDVERARASLHRALNRLRVAAKA